MTDNSSFDPYQLLSSQLLIPLFLCLDPACLLSDVHHGLGLAVGKLGSDHGNAHKSTNLNIRDDEELAWEDAANPVLPEGDLQAWLRQASEEGKSGQGGERVSKLKRSACHIG